VATTYRKATVTPRKESPSCSTVGLRKHHNVNRLDRQDRIAHGTSHRLVTFVPLFAAIASTASSLHARTHGSTVSVFDGNLLGRSYFAVSQYPERSVELGAAPTRDMLFAFAILNADLLLQVHHALGTWFNSRHGTHVLDVVLCLRSFKDAVRIGRDGGQQAIFDLRNAKEISLTPAHKAPAIEFFREES
jgi:hypothetical protein